MKLQEFIADRSEEALNEIFRIARLMPADKVTWKPADTTRSVLEQLQEIVQSASWVLPMIADRQSPEFSPDMLEQAKLQRKQWDTIDLCETAARESAKSLFDAVRNLTDEELEEEVMVAWVGKKLKLSQIAMFYYWNTTYHIGQINYIQTLYGDNEMH